MFFWTCSTGLLVVCDRTTTTVNATTTEIDMLIDFSDMAILERGWSRSDGKITAQLVTCEELAALAKRATAFGIMCAHVSIKRTQMVRSETRSHQDLALVSVSQRY